MNQKKSLLVAIFTFLFIPATSLAALSYTPMEPIPGAPSNSGNFYDYISAVYKFGIWAVGISALLMITIGGYMYIMSAANVASAEKAKTVIADAIIGLILALTSYLLLYEINPNLVKMSIGPVIPPATTTPPGETPPPPTTPPAGGPGVASNPNNLTCSFNGVDQATLNVCSAQVRPGGCGTSSCSQYSASIQRWASGAATATVLKTFMVIESDCNISAGTASSYGLMQISPATVNGDASLRSRCGVAAVIDGNWLKNPLNADASICLGAGIINKYAAACGSNPRNIYAAYNAGSGNCSPSADCSSDTSCSGGAMQRWECPFDTQKTVCNTGMQETRQGATYVNYCLTHLGF